MRTFLLWMLPPVVLLLLMAVFAPRDDLLDISVAAVAVDDESFHRLAEEQLAEVGNPKHPFRLTAIDRPGLPWRIALGADAFARIEEQRGYRMWQKFIWEDARVALADGPAFPALVHVRGHSTTRADKKSFNVNLLSTQRFTADVKARSILLLNLLYDPTGIETAFSIRCLSELGLWPGYWQHVVVEVNGEPQGLYLQLERPVDAIRRVHANVVSVFRKRPGEWEDKYIAPGSDALRTVVEMEALRFVDDPAEQARALAEVLDLDAHMRWLAFNSLLENGDSFDEVFYYELRAPDEVRGRVRVVAWDYDDVQTNPLVQTVKDPLLWGAAQPVDYVIAGNPTLRARYADVLRELLGRFDRGRLQRSMDAVVDSLDVIDPGLGALAQVQSIADRHARADEIMTRLRARHSWLTEQLAAEALCDDG